MLFPDWSPESKLVGIARLAAEGPLLEAKRRVDYHELPTRRLIGRCSSERMPFEWTINPYRGCEFGCKYCYARYTHEFMELRRPEQFEEQIFAKEFQEAAFRNELRKLPPGKAVAIGTATDPYQPAERRYRVTRRILEALLQERPRPVWITTKSDLAARDVDLIAALQRRGTAHVNMTVTTLDEQLARLLEPYAPRPSLRIAAVQKLTEAGVPCGVLCCPLMPLINDSERNLDGVARSARAAGATWLYANVLFLKPCAKQVFLPFVEQQFPSLARRYHERFDKGPFLRGEYVALMEERLRIIRERHGLDKRISSYSPVELSEQGQMDLFEMT